MLDDDHHDPSARPSRSDEHYTWRVTVPARDRLDQLLVEQVGSLAVDVRPDGATVLYGALPDLSAVYGLVLRLRDAAVPLLCLHVERRPSVTSHEH